MARAESDMMRAEKLLRKCALEYPDAYEEFPWGERAIKVRKKVFLFMSAGKGGLSLSTKLPESGPAALMMPFAEPTHYGLGKSGWVTAYLTDTKSLDLIKAWVEESYRAIAPKKLVKALS